MPGSEARNVLRVERRIPHDEIEPYAAINVARKDRMATTLTPRQSTTALASTTAPNVGGLERILTAAAGGALVLASLQRPSTRALPAALIGAGLLYRGMSGYCPVYSLFDVDRAGYGNPSVGVRAKRGDKCETSILIQRSPEELYALWRDLERLPQFMRHLSEVEVLNETQSRWVAKGPIGGSFEWHAEIINDHPNELIAWRSLPGASVDSAGSVRFERAPHGRGTILHVSLKYDPPGGKAAATVTRWLHLDLEKQIEADLRRFRTIVEAGEAPSTRGQPRGTCGH